MLPQILAWMEGYISTSSIVNVISLSKMIATLVRLVSSWCLQNLDIRIALKKELVETTFLHIPDKIHQPWGHVLQAQMLQLDGGASEALNALLKELQCQMRFIERQFLAHRFDENGVVAWDAKT